ncbi:ABC transporter permease [Devosia sp. XJ19-1]|uniref:ABC transporter permease n=1 Tax=Devosia ureilytica TaxID=2952754 RepID=A0A9Q4FU13_9HYPH|nr:ABC transporter permease [Devosia ureilytica]MCP8884620.1 ABC transporter permease [Devosia ureilytica]MCP8888250.1 ABC transporter permease [Devosia ureilytica]
MTLAPRWRKLIGDFSATQGRIALMFTALAIGMFALTTIAGAYAILSREIARNYLQTNPASALIDVGAVTPDILATIAADPGIVAAEPTSIVVARSRSGEGTWHRSLLFVVPDFSSADIGRTFAADGQFPPAVGTVLVEREAMGFLGAAIGGTISIQTSGGTVRDLPVAGSVHDPSLAPAWQEQTAYIYLTSETAAQLGLPLASELVKVVVRDAALGQDHVDGVVAGVSRRLVERGVTVHQVQIPPVNQHPHQSQMNGVLGMFLMFALLALILSAVLTAAMVSALLAQQVRQIAIMKAIGGTSRQIGGLYLVGIAVVAAAALAVAIPLGLYGAAGFASVISQLLNFDIASPLVSTWLIVALVATGLLLPLILVAVPIRKATRATVREVLADQGVAADALRNDPIQRLLGRFTGIDRTLLLALRNAFRKRGRLLLNIGLLGTAGAMFVAALNVEAAWQGQLVEAAGSRDYDIEMNLLEPVSPARLAEALAGVGNIAELRPTDLISGAAGREDGLMLVRTYPDGGHGSLSLRPLGSLPADPEFIAGSRADAAAIVLNQQAWNLLGRPALDAQLLLAVEGRTLAATPGGIVRQILTPATAYLPPDLFAVLVDHHDGVAAIRLVLAEDDAASVAQTAVAASEALNRAGIAIEQLTTEATLAAAQSGHVAILIIALKAMALLMAAVGSIGLAASQGSSVVERTREFGIMRTIGAGGGPLMRNILAEGLMIALLSLPLALIAGIPLGYSIGQLVGTMSFGLPLPLTISTGAIGIWTLILVAGSVLASLTPARQAARLTIRQTLAYN